MTVEFQDYYATLGVERGATHDEIRKAYRKLARKHHPDVDKSKGANDRFKSINEAHEVLGDPKKRERYDRLGANWEAGEEFTPPPGYEKFHFEGGPGAHFAFGDSQEFSSFFESLFGGGESSFRGAHSFGRRARQKREPDATITVELEDVVHGATRRLTLGGEDGRARTLDVKIPKGIANGSVIRLAGQGFGGEDLLLRVEFAPHERFQLDGFDLTTRLAISPWEAALGAKVALTTLEGAALEISVPPGSSSGRKLRLRGQGLARRDGKRGDLFAQLEIAVPEHPSEDELRLFRELQRVSSFRPRPLR